MGLIPDEIIGEIRERSDIVAIIGEHVKLRKAGQNHKGLCPFHREKTPSFNVNGDKGFFYCFGCQKKGDAFTFVMEYEGRSFLEAAKRLADRAGLAIPEPELSAEGQRRRSLKQKLLAANELAAAFYEKALMAPGGETARAYLEARGIGEDMWRAFRLGFAPDAWDRFLSHASDNGMNGTHCERAGLAVPRKSGGHYDRFRNRLMCPVIDASGAVLGFSGRTLADGDDVGAKYINSPESPIYKKSHLLYGSHRARTAFRKAGRAILVEGNFDVIGLHGAGFAETVAPLGTALTGEQADILRRQAGSVTLLFDGDRAGRAAALKALRTLVSADVAVKIASLPDGEDPDSLIRSQGADAMTEVIERAQGGVEFFIYEVWAKTGASSDDRAQAMKDAAPVIASITDPTKRDLVLGTFATAMGTDEKTLRAGLRRALISERNSNRNSSESRRSEPVSESRTSAPRAAQGTVPPTLELQVLAILADHPALMSEADELGVRSFLTDPQLRDMYSAAQAGQPMLSAATETLRPEIAQKILSGDYAQLSDPSETLRGACDRLRHYRQRTQLMALQKQVVEAKRRGDADRERALVKEILNVKRQVD